MKEENTTQKFRLKKIEKARNYYIKEIDQNELMGKQHKKICRVLNFVEQLLIFGFYSYQMCFVNEFCSRILKSITQ